MDAVQLDFFADDPQNSPMLLSSIGEGIQNDCGVYTKNVLEFREGLLPLNYVCVRLCAVGKNIHYEFSDQAETYGCRHPLCRPCHECHRSNSAQFLADAIYNVFVNGVIPYDRNLQEDKEKKELAKLCRKACDRIAKEIN